MKFSAIQLRPSLRPVLRFGRQAGCYLGTSMSDPLPDPDEEIVVKLPEEASLDDLIAGLEASWQGTGAPKPEQNPRRRPQSSP